MLCAGRLRPDNPYLLLDEFGEAAPGHTGLTTELGIMNNEDGGQPPAGGGAGNARGPGVFGGGGRDGPGADSIDRKFSLGEEDDVATPGARVGVSQPRNRIASS